VGSKEQHRAQQQRRAPRTARRASSREMTQSSVVQGTAADSDNAPTIAAAIVEHQPAPSYAAGRAALADVLVLQMFDSGVGETLQMVYTMLRQHQERTNRRIQQARATEALREHLARLDERQDDV